MIIILAIILGGFFGFSLAFVGATEYKNILKMLRLENLNLAKIILFAIGLSSMLISIFSLLGLFDISHFHVKSMNLGVIIGGLLFGLSFGSVGTCPGTCVGALSGNNIKKAISGILGGLLGAFTFSLSYGFFNKLGIFNIFNLGRITLFNISPEYPHIFNIDHLGLLLSGLIFIVIAYLLPSKILE